MVANADESEAGAWQAPTTASSALAEWFRRRGCGPRTRRRARWPLARVAVMQDLRWSVKERCCDALALV
jgi:hypothetical protein